MMIGGQQQQQQDLVGATLSLATAHTTMSNVIISTLVFINADNNEGEGYGVLAMVLIADMVC